MSRVKFQINENESDQKKKQLIQYIIKNFGDQATFIGDCIEVEENDESKTLHFFDRIGFHYKKAS